MCEKEMDIMKGKVAAPEDDQVKEPTEMDNEIRGWLKENPSEDKDYSEEDVPAAE